MFRGAKDPSVLPFSLCTLDFAYPWNLREMASYTGGAKASSRIKALEAERKKRQDELKNKKDEIAAASDQVVSKATSDRFTSRSEIIEKMLKVDTVGLVTHQDFKARRMYLEKCAADESGKRKAAERQAEKKLRRKKLKTANRSKLSFAVDSEDESDEESDEEVGKAHRQDKGNNSEKVENTVLERDDKASEQELKPSDRRRKGLGKNPDVDVSYLPDRERMLEEQAERERLKQQWVNEQEEIKNEQVAITYSYWTGTGRRRSLRCKKGTTVGSFLAMVQKEFKELRRCTPEELMFIKEDLIIPHHYSFYDFLVTKARGVSYPFQSNSFTWP